MVGLKKIGLDDRIISDAVLLDIICQGTLVKLLSEGTRPKQKIQIKITEERIKIITAPNDKSKKEASSRFVYDTFIDTTFILSQQDILHQYGSHEIVCFCKGLDINSNARRVFGILFRKCGDDNIMEFLAFKTIVKPIEEVSAEVLYC